MPPIRNERSRWRQSNSEARSQMSSPQSVPFFLPFSNSPWRLDKGDTISKFLDLVHRTPKWQRYAQSYFQRTDDGQAIIQQEQPFVDDFIVVGNRIYSFPSVVIFQAIARILSEAAIREYHNRHYRVTHLIEAAVRHIQIQYISADRINMPSAFSAFAMVDDDNKIVQMSFSCSPGGSDSTRERIRMNRQSSFYSEWQQFESEWEARCQRIAVLRSENPRSVESQAELSVLYKQTTPSRHPAHCAEPELFFALETHAVRNPNYASTHRMFVLSADVIREGERDAITAKQFYGNCCGLQKALDRRWKRIVDVGLVRNGEVVGYLT